MIQKTQIKVIASILRMQEKNQNGQSVDYNYKAFYVEDGQLYEDETNCDESSVLYRAEKNYPETIENLFTLMFSDNNELLIKKFRNDTIDIF